MKKYNNKLKITNITLASLFFLLIYAQFNFSFANTTKVKVYTIAVIDGDTILVNYKGAKKKVRLLGIQATELTTLPPEPYSRESKALVQKIIEKQYIVLEHKKTKYLDKYHRILGGIYFNDLWINEYLIKQGLAFVYIINGTDIPGIKQLIEAEDQAINNKIGLWALKNYQVITAAEAKNYIGKYKIIDATIKNTKITKNSLWLFLEDKENKGFSLRLENNSYNQNKIKELKHQEIRARGFINKYNPRYGPIINVKNINQIEILD